MRRNQSEAECGCGAKMPVQSLGAHSSERQVQRTSNWKDDASNLSAAINDILNDPFDFD